jgi:signal peptidase II
MRRYLLVAFTVLILDQLTKWAALQYLVRHSEVPLLPFLNLTLVFNSGAAFGFLSWAGGWQTWFFAIVAVVACVVAVSMLRRLGPKDMQLALALALILGGAAGNLTDRLLYGYVIDFIDFYFGTWHFWTFNIADSAISIGAVLLVLDSFGMRLVRPTAS